MRAQGFRQRLPVHLAEQPLQGRLAGRPPVQEAQGTQPRARLPRAALRDGQLGELVGQDRRYRQAEHRRQRVGHARQAAGVGHTQEGRRQAPRRNPQRDRRLIHARGYSRPNSTLLPE